MKVSHSPTRLSAVFDYPNLVSCGGLAPVMSRAERCGLHDLVAAKVRLAGSAGANASVKVSSLVAGMVVGADSIDDMNLLRHGGMDRLFGGVRAPSTSTSAAVNNCDRLRDHAPARRKHGAVPTAKR